MIADVRGPDAVGLGNPNDIGKRHAARRIAAYEAALKVVLLGGRDGAISAVAQHKILDRKIQPANRFQLLNVQLETAVAIDANGAPAAARQTCSDASRKSGPHCAQARGV